jgi:hypothetical protein
VITCYDPEKLYPDGRLDYLRENRTRERQYDFDHVFGPKSDQQEVYETLGAPLVPVVISGYNATGMLTLKKKRLYLNPPSPSPFNPNPFLFNK